MNCQDLVIEMIEKSIEVVFYILNYYTRRIFSYILYLIIYT